MLYIAQQVKGPSEYSIDSGLSVSAGKMTGEKGYLHGTHVKAAQEELQGDDQPENGAVHVCRCPTVPWKHGQKVWLLITGRLRLLPVGISLA